MQETWVQSLGWNARVGYDLATKPPRPQEFGGRGKCLRILVRSRENLPVTLARGYPLGWCGPICNRAQQHIARRRAVWSVDGTRSMVAAGSVSTSTTAPSRGGLSSSKSRGWSSPSAIALPVCIPRRENVTRPTCGSESLPPWAAAAAEAGERSECESTDKPCVTERRPPGSLSPPCATHRTGLSSQREVGRRVPALCSDSHHLQS